jgi:hypothetical protein
MVQWVEQQIAIFRLRNFITCYFYNVIHCAMSSFMYKNRVVVYFVMT